MLRSVLGRMSGLLLIWSTFLWTAAAEEPPQGKQASSQSDPSSQSFPSGAKSLAEDSFRNSRRRFGFSIGVYETYESNVYYRSAQQTRAFATAFFPRIFLNLGRRDTRFNLDYGFGYSIYQNNRSLDANQHYANATLDLQLSRKVALLFSDQFASSPYGYGSTFGSVLSPSYSVPSAMLGPTYSTPVVSSEVFVDRQRIIRNLATASLNVRPTRKLGIGFFFSHQAYAFKSTNQGDINGFHTGATLDFQITRWLSLYNTYSTYFNSVDERYRDARIHRIQVGGLNFRLSRGWQATASGGVEYTNYFGRKYWTGNAAGALMWHSERNIFGVNYNRGLFSAIGLYTVMQSQQGTVNFGSRLTPWMNLQLAAIYVRSANYGRSGQLEYYLAHSGLEFAVRNDLIFSVNGMLMDQRAQNLGSLAQNRKAYVAHVGLQYLYPAGRR